MQFITKVKIKEGAVEIRYKEDAGRAEKETVYKCSEDAHPDFLRALSALIPTVYDILQLPSEWRYSHMKIIGVSYNLSESTDVEGAVITGLVDLDTSNSPFCFNTPHLPFDQYSESGNSPLMKLESIKKLEHLKEEARAYIGGKRAQLVFKLGEDK